MSEVEDLLAELEALTGSDARPFPYEGCRRLQVAVGEGRDTLAPDLDVYLSELAGYRTWGRKILEWTDDKIDAVEKRLHQSFFDRFPAHAELRPLLSTQASDVIDALQTADQTRDVLLRLLSAIRRIRRGIHS
jgi:hypothetical protein